MTPPIIEPVLLLLLLETWFAVELGRLDADEGLATSLGVVTVGDDSVGLAAADGEDDEELVSACTEEGEEILVVEDVGVA